MTQNSSFADRLKEIMVEQGYSYGKLGELLNMNPQTLNRYVLGTRVPKKDVIVGIAEVLAVDPQWLQGFDAKGEETAASALPPDRGEEILLHHFRSLNPDGRTKAIAYTYALLGLYPAVAAFEPIPEFYSPTPDPDTANVQAEEKPESGKPDARPAEPEKPDKLLPPEQMEALCQEFSPTYKMDLVEYKLTANILIVTAKPSFFMDEDSFISVSCGYAATTSSKLFRSTEAETAAFFFQTDMVDKQGNESVKNVLKIILSRDGFHLRENIEHSVAADYNLVFQMADEFYIHPAIKLKLKLFQA